MSDECSHVVVEQAMKPYIAKAQLSMATFQLLLPIGAQCEQRAAAAHRVLPGMFEMRASSREVARKIRGHFSSIPA